MRKDRIPLGGNAGMQMIFPYKQVLHSVEIARNVIIQTQQVSSGFKGK
jgi:hypothetical protein